MASPTLTTQDETVLTITKQSVLNDRHSCLTCVQDLGIAMPSSMTAVHELSDASTNHTLTVMHQARLPRVEGLRLWCLMGVLSLALLMSAIEQIIIGPALITISEDLGRYGLSSWIVNSYLLTYNGFLMIFARRSDIYGRRSAFLAALVIFTLASIGCGAARSMQQLIAFRAVQGIGSAGLFTLAMNSSTEISGNSRGIMAGLISGAFGIAADVSPILGGAIVSKTSWRWVFLLNVPLGTVLIGFTFLFFPKNLVKLDMSRRSLGRIDWLGATLYLIAIVNLNYGLAEGGTAFAWHSATIIVPLVISGSSWIGLIAWEQRLTAKGTLSQALPLLPLRLFRTRAGAFAMITAFLSGIPLYSVYTYLPIRNAFVATGLSAALCNAKNLSFPILVASMGLQSIALGIISTSTTTKSFPPQLYAPLVMLGVGLGVALPTVALIARMELTHQDHGVNMSAISTARSLGGTIGVSIGNIILSSRVWLKLQESMSKVQLSQVQLSNYTTGSFTANEVTDIRSLLGDGFDSNIRIDMYVAIVAFLVSLGCYVRNPRQVHDVDQQEDAEKEMLDRQAEGLQKVLGPLRNLATPDKI